MKDKIKEIMKEYKPNEWTLSMGEIGVEINPIYGDLILRTDEEEFCYNREDAERLANFILAKVWIIKGRNFLVERFKDELL